MVSEKAGDTVSVLLHFLSLLSFWILDHNIYVKTFVCQRQMLRGALACPVSFLWYCRRVEGVTMAVCGVGGHSMGHLPPQEEDGEQDTLEAL